MATKLRAGRGRNVLLWAAGLYLAAILVLDVAIDSRWPELRSPYLVDILYQLGQVPSGGPQVVCIGTSRFGMAFSADEVQAQLQQTTGDARIEVFNASAGSQDLITIDFIMSQLLAKGARPRLAVIEVTPEMVARYDLWFGNHVLPALTAGNLRTYLGDLRRAWLNTPGIIADRAYPVYRCRRQVWSVAGDALAEDCGLDLKPADPDVWSRRGSAARAANVAAGLAQNTSASGMFLDTDQSAQRHARVEAGLRTLRGWLRNYEVGGLTCEALQRLLQRCRQHDVRVVLAVPPMGSEQRALYTPQIEAAFRDCVDQCCQWYGCAYVDCREYLPDACFHDNHHVLFPQGSVPFSRRLAQEVLTPEWRVISEPETH
jgi:hypothetical protein